MAGIVQSQMPGGGAMKITSKSVEDGMHLRDKQRVQLKRIVIAGMKVMFSEQSHHLLTDELQKPGDMATKLGQGIAGLMGMLMRESKNSLPPNLLIPAALVLCAHAAEYVAKTGGEMNDQVLGQAMQICLHSIMGAFHLDPNKVEAMGAKAAGAAAPGPVSPPNDPAAQPPGPPADPMQDPTEGAM